MLKKENFEIRGRVLPVAYAVVRKTETNHYNRGAAIIGIAETRELALSNPLKEVIVQFEVSDRDINDRKLAYLSATMPYMVEEDDENGNKIQVEKKPFFYGWEKELLDSESSD